MSDKKGMLKSLKSAIEIDSIYKKKAKYSRIFSRYEEDPDFKELVK